MVFRSCRIQLEFFILPLITYSTSGNVSRLSVDSQFRVVGIVFLYNVHKMPRTMNGT